MTKTLTLTVVGLALVLVVGALLVLSMTGPAKERHELPDQRAVTLLATG